MGLRGQLRQWLHIVIWRRKLVVVGQGHSGREVHLYTVMDVLLLDQSAGGRYDRKQEVIADEGIKGRGINVKNREETLFDLWWTLIKQKSK